jgi:hypothetical protein
MTIEPPSLLIIDPASSMLSRKSHHSILCWRSSIRGYMVLKVVI